MSLVFDGAFNDLRFYIWYALYHPCAVDAYLGCAAVLQTLLRQPWRCWAILSHRSMIGCLHGASPTTLKWRCRMTFSWRSLRRLTTAFWLFNNTARKKPRLANWKPRTTTKTPGIGPPRWMTTMTMTIAIQIMDGHPGGVGKGTAGILGQAGPGTKRIMTMMMIGAMTMSMTTTMTAGGVGAGGAKIMMTWSVSRRVSLLWNLLLPQPQCHWFNRRLCCEHRQWILLGPQDFGRGRQAVMMICQRPSSAVCMRRAGHMINRCGVSRMCS